MTNLPHHFNITEETKKRRNYTLSSLVLSMFELCFGAHRYQCHMHITLTILFVSTVNPLLFLALQANRTCPICRADASEVHRDSE